MLPSHGRYDYLPIKGRPVYDWPNGKRLAVYLGLNLEHFAFGEGLGAELAPGGPQPDILNYAWRDYGNRVGAWRMLDLFEKLKMPASVLVNSAMYDYAPALVGAFRARGDEIVGHGRTNAERQGTLDEAAERALIAESTARMDDQPIWLRTRNGGRILAVPYPQEINDIPAIVGRKIGGDAFADMIIDTFDEMLEQVADGPLVMGIALHAYLVGQPHRLRHLRRALTHIARLRDKVWFTTAGAVAEYCHALPPGVVPGG
jgi:allantoinase